MTLYRLYLGRDIKGGTSYVTDGNFDRFLKVYVTPTFPGFTVINSLGYWEGNAEACYVFEILTGFTTTNDGEKVREIAQAYKNAFSQDSVLITSHEVYSELV